ncbi:MAG TPA: CDP-diacylglycerol--serine O-phosphatidyltransferase [Chromatiales bacterium]|nr:CDP-diacylglycerol--serine O-phosphatidyltransferase [Chromatiales bacterium]
MENERAQRRRGIYLLPNLLTTGALFAGFYAIVAAMGGRHHSAAVALLVAAVLDGLDGRIARLTGTQTDFGAQYDSLSDVIAFGLAPALVVYHWGLAHLAAYGWLWAKLGWLAAFVYAACTALRLARFNTQLGVADRRHFQGLPSPAAAGLLATLVWMASDLGLAGEALAVPALVLTLLAAGLMVSNLRYHSFKELDLRSRVPFVAVVAVVLVLAFGSIDPPKALFAAALVYALSGPALTLVEVQRRRNRRAARERLPR